MNSFKPEQKSAINIVLLTPLLLVLFTVFVVDNFMANPTVSAKYVWFGVTLIISTVCALTLFMLNGRKVRVSIIDCLLSIFVLWGIVLTYYKYNDFAFNLYVLLLLWAFYVVCRITIEQYKFYTPILLLALLISGFLEALWGLGQLYGCYFSQHNSFAITGSFYNPGPYAGYLSLVLPISLYYILLDYYSIKNKKKQSDIILYIRWYFSLFTFVSIILILPATMSRASWIATFISCLFIIVHNMPRRNRGSFNFLQNKRKILLGYSSFFLIIGIALWGVYSLKADSADGRYFIWRNSITVILNNPNGVGIGYFSGAYGKVQANYFTTQLVNKQERFVAGAPESAFNEYLQIGVEFGVIPLLLFISILILTFYVGYKHKKIPVLAGLLSLLIFAMMSYPFSLLPFLIVLLVFIALCISNSCEENRENINFMSYNYYFLFIIGSRNKYL